MPEAAGLFYEEHGSGGEGPPLVFVHGAGGNRLHWPPEVRRLPGRRTLAVDLPGHGASTSPGAPTVGEMAVRLAEWLEAIDAPPAVIVGHSMGSAIALHMRLEAPERVAGLVLIGSGPRLPVNPDLLQETADPERFRGAVEKILRWSFSPEARPGLVELARQRMIEAGAATLHRDLEACNAFDLGSRARDIDCPALILVGAGDRMTPPRLSGELQQTLPRASLEEIEGAGHMLMLERPGVVVERLESFCRRSFPETS